MRKRVFEFEPVPSSATILYVPFDCKRVRISAVGQGGEGTTSSPPNNRSARISMGGGGSGAYFDEEVVVFPFSKIKISNSSNLKIEYESLDKSQYYIELTPGQQGNLVKNGKSSSSVFTAATGGAGGTGSIYKMIGSNWEVYRTLASGKKGGDGTLIP